jgi:hypothetical protein
MMSRRPTSRPREAKPFTLHLIDGTYELFRHFYGSANNVHGTEPIGADAPR